MFRLTKAQYVPKLAKFGLVPSLAKTKLKNLTISNLQKYVIIICTVLFLKMLTRPEVSNKIVFENNNQSIANSYVKLMHTVFNLSPIVIIKAHQNV